MKGSAVFYWIVGLLLVTLAIAASFYFDESVRQFMREHQNHAVHAVMENVSRFGDWLEHFVVGLILLVVALWRGNRPWKRIFLAMLIALAIAGLLGRALKITTGRARPSVKSEQVWNGPHLAGAKYHSFPSGHVIASTGFFGVLLFARRRIGLACLPIPALIGFARLYIDAHWFSDVVCAAVLGAVSALVIYRFLLPRLFPQPQKL